MLKLLVLFIFTIPAYGSLLLEPYVALSIGGGFEDDSEEGDYSGTSYGAKFGFQHTYFFGGFDYRLGVFDLEADSSGYSLDGKSFNNEQYFLFAGLDLPTFFRVWGGLAVGGRADSGDFEFTEGGGALLGAGYKGFQVISLNLEYVAWNYGKVDPGSDSELEGSHILFSLSTPIRF